MKVSHAPKVLQGTAVIATTMRAAGKDAGDAAVGVGDVDRAPPLRERKARGSR